MVSFFKKRSSTSTNSNSHNLNHNNANSTGSNSGGSNNGGKSLSSGSSGGSNNGNNHSSHNHGVNSSNNHLNDYIIKSSENYIDQTHYNLLKTSSLPLPNSILSSSGHLSNTSGSGNNNNSNNGNNNSNSSFVKGHNRGQGSSGSSSGSSNGGSGGKSSYHHNHNSNNNSGGKSNGSGSGGKYHGNNLLAMGSPPPTDIIDRFDKKSSAKRNSVVYTDKQVFPYGVKRELKGIMLMGEGREDVITRARTYINQLGELHFTTEDLDQYMLPGYHHHNYQQQSQTYKEPPLIELKEAKIVTMSIHGFESDTEDDWELENDDGGIYSPTSPPHQSFLSSWVPKSPEPTPRGAKLFKSNGNGRIKSGEVIEITDSDDSDYESYQTENHNHHNYQNNNYSRQKINRSSSQMKPLDNNFQDVEILNSISSNTLGDSTVDNILNDLTTATDIPDIDLRTEDISRMDSMYFKSSIHASSNNDQDATDDEATDQDDDSFSEILNDYQFYSKGTQKGRKSFDQNSGYNILIQTNTNNSTTTITTKQQIPPQHQQKPYDYRDNESISDDESSSDYDSSSDSSDDDSIDSDDQDEKLLSIRSGKPFDINVVLNNNNSSSSSLDSNDHNNSDDQNEEPEHSYNIKDFTTPTPVVTSNKPPQQPKIVQNSNTTIQLNNNIIMKKLNLPTTVNNNLKQQQEIIQQPQTIVKKEEKLLEEELQLQNGSIPPPAQDDGDSTLLDTLTMLIDEPLNNSDTVLKKELSRSNLFPTIAQLKRENSELIAKTKEQVKQKEELKSSIDDIFNNILSTSSGSSGFKNYYNQQQPQHLQQPPQDRRYTIANTNTMAIEKGIEAEKNREYDRLQELKKQRELEQERQRQRQKEIEKQREMADRTREIEKTFQEIISPPISSRSRGGIPNNSNALLDIEIEQLKRTSDKDQLLADSISQTSPLLEKLALISNGQHTFIQDESETTNESLSSDEGIEYYQPNSSSTTLSPPRPPPTSRLSNTPSPRPTTDRHVHLQNFLVPNDGCEDDIQDGAELKQSYMVPNKKHLLTSSNSSNSSSKSSSSSNSDSEMSELGTSSLQQLKYQHESQLEKQNQKDLAQLLSSTNYGTNIKTSSTTIKASSESDWGNIYFNY